ncbi:uncharacterized protein LOC141911577 [Tubulanus polymorphus]|uniref:uncharacterized protein LOC141911577 n=1 Tax=Tubulanus polymorphus TaxID=672921 RepID=UPI003DA6CCE6
MFVDELFWIVLAVLQYGILVSARFKGDATGLGIHRDEGLTDLVDEFWENKILLQKIPRPYEIVYPVRIHNQRVVNLSTRSQIGRHIVHVDKAVVELDLFGRKYRIHLELNHGLLSHAAKRKHFLSDNTQVITDNIEHCYYQGSISKIAGSSVAVSTCDGFRGVINLPNVTYIIAPLRGGDLDMDHPHVLYRAIMAHSQSCGTIEERWYKFTELESHSEEYLTKLKYNNVRNKRQISERRILQLGLISDHYVYKKINSTRLSDHAMFLMNTANVVDLYLKQLKIRVQVVYLEIWNTGHQVEPADSMKEMLRQMLLYKPSALFNTPHHNVQFITGGNFHDDVTTMSIPESICSDRSIGLNRFHTYYQPLELAHAVAHSIAHNLGVKHDHGGCVCLDKSGCLMESRIQGPGDHLRLFSICSKNALDDALSLGIGDCLVPGHDADDVYPMTCGNGRLERGEQCDCRSPQHCLLTDPCCDPDTCLLRKNADCNNGDCCRNCTIVRKSLPCRAASGECDIAEYCDGSSGDCPADSNVVDGTPCADNHGFCYHGICPTHTQQCRQLWGPDATTAQMMCYTRFNGLGTFSGHCGANYTTHLYNRCYPEDVLCGLLHCVGGTVNPHLPVYDVTHTLSMVSIKGNQFQCKVINSPSVPQFPQDGVVIDGTKCGSEHVCIKHRCVNTKQIIPGTCPTALPRQICSGHGVCSSNLECVCFPRWTGRDCNVIKPTTIAMTTVSTTVADNQQTTSSMTNRSMFVNSTIIRLPPGGAVEGKDDVTGVWLGKEEASDGISTDTLLIILAGVAGSLVVVFGFFLLCYRRRSPNGGLYVNNWLLGGKKKKVDKNGRPTSIGSEEAPNINRIIKFGSMPSYREEKEQERQQRRRMIMQGMMEYTDDEEGTTMRLVSPDEDPYPSPAISLDKVPEKGILKNGSQSPNRVRRAAAGSGVHTVAELEGEESDHSPERNGSVSGSREGLLGAEGDDDLKKSDSDAGSLCSDYGSIEGGTLPRGVSPLGGGSNRGVSPLGGSSNRGVSPLEGVRSGTPTSVGSNASKGSRSGRSNIRHIGDLIRQIEEQVANKPPPTGAATTTTCDDTAVQTDSPEGSNGRGSGDYSSSGSSESYPSGGDQHSPDYGVAPLARDEVYSPVNELAPVEDGTQFSPDDNNAAESAFICENCPSAVYPCEHETFDAAGPYSKALRSPSFLKRTPSRSPDSPASTCSDNTKWHYSPIGSPRLQRKIVARQSPSTSPRLQRRYEAPDETERFTQPPLPYKQQTGLNQNTQIDPLARSPSTPPESHAGSPPEDQLPSNQPQQTMRKYIDCIQNESSAVLTDPSAGIENPSAGFKANIVHKSPWKKQISSPSSKPMNCTTDASSSSSSSPARKFFPSLKSNFFNRSKSASPETKRRRAVAGDDKPTNVPVRAGSESPRVVHASVPSMMSTVAAPPSGPSLQPPASRPKSFNQPPALKPTPKPRPGKPEIPAENLMTKVSNLPPENLDDPRRRKSPSQEFYKRFSPIFPPDMLLEDSFKVDLVEPTTTNLNDLSPTMRYHDNADSPDHNNPYSPDESPNDAAPSTGDNRRIADDLVLRL